MNSDLPVYGTVLQHPSVDSLIAMVVGIDADRHSLVEGPCLLLLVLQSPGRPVTSWEPGTVERGWWWYSRRHSRAMVLS